MMGYTFAIIAVLVFISLFLLLRMGGAQRRGTRREDYRRGTTYEKPQDEGPPRDAPPPDSQRS